jgi:periplasmic mercuric ion binding protein
MKIFLQVAVLTLSLGATFSAFAAEQTVTMDIEKMTCALCPITVKKSMEGVDGVQDVDVDFDSKTAVVTFDDSKTTAAAVAQASTDVGYPATPVQK